MPSVLWRLPSLALTSGVVAKELKRRGVTVRTGAAVTGVAPSGDGVRITLRAGDAQETIDAEYALVAVGRAPVVEDLGLETIGLGTERVALPRIGNDVATGLRRSRTWLDGEGRKQAGGKPSGRHQRAPLPE